MLLTRLAGACLLTIAVVFAIVSQALTLVRGSGSVPKPNSIGGVCASLNLRGNAVTTTKNGKGLSRAQSRFALRGSRRGEKRERKV